MTVIDIRDDPRLDMEMAQSISNILKSVGRMEQNRQKRYRLDQMMSDINSGADPMTALQDASNTKAPYGEGLAGVGQRIGGFLGGHTQNLTDAMIEKSFINKLSNYQKQQDPMYQAQLAASKAGTAGKVQATSQSDEMHPVRKEAAEAGIEATKAGTDRSRQAYGQSETMNPLEVEALKAKTRAIDTTVPKRRLSDRLKWNAALDKKFENGEDLSDQQIRDHKRQAEANDMTFNIEDVTNHSRHIKGKDGKWYRKNDDGTPGKVVTPSNRFEYRPKPKAKAEAPSSGGRTVSIQNEKGVSEGKFTIPSGKTLFKKKDGSFVTIPDKNIEGYMKANPGVIRYQIGE